MSLEVLFRARAEENRLPLGDMKILSIENSGCLKPCTGAADNVRFKTPGEGKNHSAQRACA